MKTIFPRFNTAIKACRDLLVKHGRVIHPKTWQGVEAKPMFEINNISFTVKNIPDDFAGLTMDIGPDLPWAEDHFLERVSGMPLNPGREYKNWPGYKGRAESFNDNNFRKDGQFTHSYMERFWPKYAGIYTDDTIRHLWAKGTYDWDQAPNSGIRYDYGDLDSLVNLLVKDPTTRQAYLPIFFPEDTGAGHGGRVPCTIGYHFRIDEENKIHIHYLIRACDYRRHFRNDVYMAARLLQWVAYEYNKSPRKMFQVELGTYTMDIIHFHVFEAEKNII